MNGILAIFKYTKQEVRFIEEKGSFEVAAVDVADALQYSDTKTLLKLIRDDEDYYKGGAFFPTPGGEQKLITLTEFGLYAVLSRSHKPKAKPFQRWLFEEVLPEIRRTGKYSGKKKKTPALTGEQLQERLALSDSYKSLSEATKIYIERHKDQLSATRCGHLHTHVGQKIGIVFLGSSATKLRKAAGVKSFRDLLSTDQLRLLQQLERLAALLIEKQDLYPTDAILEAANRLMVGV